MIKNNTDLKREELNKEYFQALGSTRASVGMLKLAWAGLFFFVIESIYIFFYIKEQYNVNPFTNYIFIFLCFYMLFLVVCQLLSFDKKLIYKHQVFGTSMLLIMINGLLLSLVLTGYILIIFTNDTLMGSVRYSVYFFFFSFLFFLGLLLYNIRWLREQLSRGFSEQRTNANYFAASSVFSKPSLWIIFGLTVLGGTFGGIIFGYGQQLFGIFCTLFFIGAFSRLIVEVAYLLYLRTKDKSYWEEVPKDIESQNIWNVLTPTKTAPRLIYEAVLWAVLRGYVLPKLGLAKMLGRRGLTGGQILFTLL
ncbi:hypothetical protein STRDD11_02633 [Streptococcus sp. DD11]|uniref:hypothetical protein n=1 Tax=Streptococcus sp. DD11 TaxID=1777879 RepID=UPI0007912BA7|nr:hypothetical protein [Streptococcus sp. DD11]KXT77449.1 hypothetical protein STRDD11_02633 [Streptococcus sp. DD11]